ncbi:hypothetical protein [Rothia sp. LK2492]|uniref:hypothetical protein n=1 Tax=Rothia sp. LK2492 TaxID=3114370 RepID=UPI0034CFD514
MAHHLADRMLNLEQKTGSNRHRDEAEVAGLILHLWSHRRDFPGDTYPLAEVDDIEATLAKLEPNRRPWGYFNVFEPGTEPSKDELETSAALKSALLIDQLAGDLVHTLVKHAATLTEARNTDWVIHAEKFGDTSLQRMRRIIHTGIDTSLEGDNWDKSIRKGAELLASAISSLGSESETCAMEPSDATHPVVASPEKPK